MNSKFLKYTANILICFGVLLIVCPILLVLINNTVDYEIRMKIMNSSPFFLKQLGSGPFVLWMIIFTSLFGSIIVLLSLLIKKHSAKSQS